MNFNHVFSHTDGTLPLVMINESDAPSTQLSYNLTTKRQ